ncbi:MAG: hypothetical protein DMENIID0002_03660 [Rickettsia endosymbiont of Sergentomyia squamirostris]|uniref:Lipoprotein n=1 Tax=Candidatus Tisiphia endosymbiont of Sergentomyia squamirostris TaxID=3113639 RepID=A0AAT9G7C6_9RICK
MFTFYRSALLAIALMTLLAGCAERNLNVISRSKISTVNDGNKALILIQTTPIVPKGGIFVSFDKRIETVWVNLSSPKEFMLTKNYQTVYIMPDVTAYNYHNIELYVVTPGHYKLKCLKYIQNNILSYTLSGGDIADFLVKGGEIVYIGNLIINIRDNNINSYRFLKEGLNIQDNHSMAESYMSVHYPKLLSRLQKRLVTLQK